MHATGAKVLSQQIEDVAEVGAMAAARERDAQGKHQLAGFGSGYFRHFVESGLRRVRGPIGDGVERAGEVV